MKLFFEPEAETSQYKLRYRQAGVFEPWNKMNKPLPVFKRPDWNAPYTMSFRLVVYVWMTVRLSLADGQNWLMRPAEIVA